MIFYCAIIAESLVFESKENFNFKDCFMKKLVFLFFIAISALFGEVNEANLDDAIKKCNANNGVACGEASEIYRKIEGRTRDEKDAKLWVEYAIKGCELRDGSSCHTIAYQYADMGGYPKFFKPDEAKKEEYLIKACDYKHSHSCRLLGIIYSGQANNKKGAEKKAAKIKSKHFYKKACDLGYSGACKEK
ncbi:hypothetical protein [Helicobacter sp. 23-1045]